VRDKLGDSGLISDDTRLVASFRQKQREHRANNPSGHRVLRYEIDGGMITQGERCDFGMGIPDQATFYFIELKGKDLKKAVRQIISTISVLLPILSGYIIHARVVLSRIQRPDLRSSEVIIFERTLAKQKGCLKRGCIVMEETI
jgi:hypothetical protein